MEDKKDARGLAMVLVFAIIASHLLGWVLCDQHQKKDSQSSLATLSIEVVGGYKNLGSTVEVVKLEGTDALYLRTTRYGDLVPYVEGDGTPVTYSEFMESVPHSER